MTTPTLLTAGADGSDSGDGYFTSAVALTAGHLHLLMFVTRRTGTAAQGSLVATQTGATWTQVATATYPSTSNTRMTVFRCQPASDVASATIHVENPDPITADWGMWQLVEWSGVLDDSANNGAGAVQQSVTNNGTGDTPNATLAAFASSLNAGQGWQVHFNTATLAPFATYTEIDEQSTGTTHCATEYKIDGTQPGSTADSTAAWAAISVEIVDDAIRGTAAGVFGGLTGTANGVKATPISGTAAGAFGALAGTALGVVNPSVDGTLAAAFGALTGAMSGNPTSPVSGVLTGAFGTAFATLLAGVPFDPAIARADILPSPWSADLLPSSWFPADLQE